jgi:hypothetical protein
MAIFGLVSSVLRFNHRRAPVEEFRDFLRQMAVSLMAIVSQVAPLISRNNGVCGVAHLFWLKRSLTCACCRFFLFLEGTRCCSIVILDLYLGRVWNEMGGIASSLGNHQ